MAERKRFVVDPRAPKSADWTPPGYTVDPRTPVSRDWTRPARHTQSPAAPKSGDWAGGPRHVESRAPLSSDWAGGPRHVESRAPLSSDWAGGPRHVESRAPKSSDWPGGPRFVETRAPLSSDWAGYPRFVEARAPKSSDWPGGPRLVVSPRAPKSSDWPGGPRHVETPAPKSGDWDPAARFVETSGMRPDRPGDPPGNYAFRVELDGVWVAFFSAVDGLQIEREMIEYSFTGDDYGRKRPGGFKYGDVTLKSGWIDTTLEEWIQNTNPSIANADMTRKSLAIVLLDNAGEEVRRWDCFECYPKAWKIATFDAKGNDVMTEELVFSIEYFVGSP